MSLNMSLFGEYFVFFYHAQSNHKTKLDLQVIDHSIINGDDTFFIPHFMILSQLQSQLVLCIRLRVFSHMLELRILHHLVSLLVLVREPSSRTFHILLFNIICLLSANIHRLLEHESYKQAFSNLIWQDAMHEKVISLHRWQAYYWLLLGLQY